MTNIIVHMKHKKLLLVFACIFAHTNPLDQKTIDMIKRSMQLCNDTPNAAKLARFLKMQLTLADYNTNITDASLIQLAQSLRSIRYSAIPESIAAYLNENGMGSSSLNERLNREFIDEYKWLAILEHQTLVLVDQSQYYNDEAKVRAIQHAEKFIELVRNINTRKDSIAYLSIIAYDSDYNLPEEAREILSQAAVITSQGTILRSINHSKVSDLLQSLNESTNVDVRFTAMIELYLDYMHAQYETKTETRKFLSLICKYSTTFAVLAVPVGFFVAKLWSEYSDTGKFYSQEFPGCQSDVCYNKQNFSQTLNGSTANTTTTTAAPTTTLPPTTTTTTTTAAPTTTLPPTTIPATYYDVTSNSNGFIFTNTNNNQVVANISVSNMPQTESASFGSMLTLNTGTNSVNLYFINNGFTKFTIPSSGGTTLQLSAALNMYVNANNNMQVVIEGLASSTQPTIPTCTTGGPICTASGTPICVNSALSNVGTPFCSSDGTTSTGQSISCAEQAPYCPDITTSNYICDSSYSYCGTPIVIIPSATPNIT